jgi:hypothetical protein
LYPLIDSLTARLPQEVGAIGLDWLADTGAAGSSRDPRSPGG